MSMLDREVVAWRRGQRERLLELRRSTLSAERQQYADKLITNLDAAFAKIEGKSLGIYWPIKHEIDIRKWADALSARRNIQLALPVVDEPRQPLSYRQWHLGAPMTRGFWNIPVPVDSTLIEPDIVIAPLVGFGKHIGWVMVAATSIAHWPRANRVHLPSASVWNRSVSARSRPSRTTSRWISSSPMKRSPTR